MARRALNRAVNSLSQRRVRFLGVDFDALTLDEAVEAVSARVLSRTGGYVVTPNADHIVRLHRFGGAVAQAYSNAWLCLNDSKVVLALARVAGVRMTCVPGADLVAQLLCSPSLPRNTPIVIVGNNAGAVSRLAARHGFTALGHLDAPMGLLYDSVKLDRVVQAIEASQTRLVLLAVGSPQQELIAYRLNRRQRWDGVAMAIGASIDFLTGQQRRAPAMARSLGFEWAFRLLSDPGRMWRRYLVNSPIIGKYFVVHLYENWHSRSDSATRGVQRARFHEHASK